MKNLIYVLALFVLPAFIMSSSYQNADQYRKKLSGVYIRTDKSSVKATIKLSTKGTYSEHWYLNETKLDYSGKWYLKKDTLVLYRTVDVKVKTDMGWENLKTIDSNKYILNIDSLGFYEKEIHFKKK